MPDAPAVDATPLERLGTPLFWRVADPDSIGFAAPLDRHGQSVRTWVRSLTAMQKEIVVRSGASGAAWRLASDEGWYLNGADIAPCPLAFMTVGMVASYMAEIAALAVQRGIALTDLKLVLDNRYTMEGSMLKGTMHAGALPPELVVHANAECDDATLTDLVHQAVDASPVNGLLRHVHTSLFTLNHNGTALAADREALAAGEGLPDPGDSFPRLARDEAAGTVQPVIEKLEEAKREENAAGGAASSLQDQQKRVLHLKGTCTARPDGILEIIEEQFAPIASTWRFLAEETPVFGGKGRAPDAASYIAAGIGFCFMTQFGRYAAMQKKKLNAYRLVQDTHFSAGGATGGTGRAGRADGVESHVFLESREDDDFARTILAVSERTCFLHALCRTDLKAKVRVVRP